MITGRAARSWAVTAIGLAFLAPGLFVAWRAASLGSSLPDVASELAGPAWRSAQLALFVGLTTAVLGTALAWLVTCSDLPGRRIWRIVLVLPIVLPSFAGTTAVLAGFTPGGLLRGLWTVVGAEPPRRIRGMFPAWLLLSAFSYPFVMMPVSARLAALRSSLDESARLLGASPVVVFFRITLPQIRAAIVGGTLIVLLYMLSEFGAVQLLGFDTLTRVIYATRQVDRATSFTASSLLFVASLVLVGLMRRGRGRDVADDRVALRPARPLPLGRLRPLGTTLCVVVAMVGIGAPVSSLVAWTWRGVADGRVELSGLASPAFNTAQVAVVSALVTLAVVLPVAFANVRRSERAGQFAAVAIVGGFALPAIVIALAVAVMTLNTPLLERAYQTLPLLIIAYVVHYASQAMSPVEQAVRGVSRSVLDSARLLEPSRRVRAQRVEFPLMRRGLVAGGGLVMLAVVKELPATLLLGPIGFRTLSTEIWASFEEGFLTDAAVASLVLLAVSGTMTWLLVVRERRTADA